ncbi:histidine kinase [Streptomyces sp. NPDC020875]|uniref:sensor histidine kinase n=1 Tax=Streptomyces sp. NPDC020875 TaxID=3154898 RepID=UPI00340C9B2B
MTGNSGGGTAPGAGTADHAPSAGPTAVAGPTTARPNGPGPGSDAAPGPGTGSDAAPETGTARSRLRRARHRYGRYATRRGIASDALSWLRNDVLILLTIAFEILDYSATAGHSQQSISPVGVVVAALVPLVLLPRRDDPVRSFTALVVLQTVSGLFVPMTYGVGVALMLAFYCVVRTADLPTTIWAGTVAATANALRTLAGDAAPMTTLPDTLGLLFVALIGIWVTRWRRQADLTRRLLAERAVADERRRIARELHDVVAHHITTVYLLSGGARTMLDHDVAASREALLTLETSARSALGEMRELLGVLRSDDGGPDEAPSEPQPGAADIAGLVAGSAVAGLPAELRITGAPPVPPAAVPATTGLTLYRITQEALTNARKHAGEGARAAVRLDYRPGEVTVEITDDGRGARPRRAAAPSPGCPGGGYGLLGMRERVAVHGGSFEAGPREGGGFRVTATLPLQLS